HPITSSLISSSSILLPPPPSSTLFPYTTLFRSLANFLMQKAVTDVLEHEKAIYHIGTTYTTNMRFWEFNEEFKTRLKNTKAQGIDRKSTRLNSSHVSISYAVFCLKKKKKKKTKY